MGFIPFVSRSKNMKERPLCSLETLKMLMIRDGLSVSAAIRKYTAMFGLPPTKEDQAHLDSIGEDK